MHLFSENALTILKDRYLWKDNEGNVVETPDGMLDRVASHVASAEEDPDIRKLAKFTFLRMMRELKFLPNSPTLMNAGRPYPYGQLSACYVIDVEDSIDGIFEALKKQAIIHKMGGGTGFNFSNLRPQGSNVSSTNGKASGPVSFMRLFNLSTDVVMQGGMRRGANMGILNVDHPDIKHFIRAKRDNNEFEYFNISVGITDEFMKKLEEGDKEAVELFDFIAENAWATGDPGLVFLDTINRHNTTPELGRLEATNPCGETPLYGGEACNLGSINLAKFVHNGEIDYGSLATTTMCAVWFLDNVIDVNHYPTEEVREKVLRTRKIGLGIMGWAEMLIQLGIPYDSYEALALAEKIMSFIKEQGIKASRYLGEVKGVCPAPLVPEMKGCRNATITCIAPTGTISLLADCSSGIEPLFSLKQIRVMTTATGEKKTLEINNKYYEEALKKGQVDEAVFKTAHDISPLWHILMQASFQKHTHLAVSKTINLPHDATIEDVKQAYLNAYHAGCKGITVYRDGSKTQQVLYRDDTTSPKQEDDCPKCGSKMVHRDGCVSCPVCGAGYCKVS
jgi:ribonucleoside-diphosphate reductase alpha chain